MLTWIQNNLPTIIGTLILAAVIALIVIKMLRDKKAGKSSCSCGCGCNGCALKEKCSGHSDK